jgi:AraC-like DNA-binding protein
MVKAKPAMNHHRDDGSDNDFNDPASWNKAAYYDDPIDSIEPLPDIPNPYRQAAIYHMRLMYVVDDFVTAAEDSRLAIVAVAVVFGWPSARGLSIANIADQLGCSPSTLTRSIARFKAMAGLGASAGDIRPGAGSLNGDKPAAVRA